MCIWQRRTSTLATVGAVTIHIEEIGTARPSELAMVVGGNRFPWAVWTYINIEYRPIERFVSIKRILLLRDLERNSLIAA